MKIRQGQPDELDTAVAIRREVTDWLQSLGSAQWANDWPDTATMLTGFARDLEFGETWFADDDGQVLAIITVNDRTDPGLWTPRETATALFVHRLTDSPSAAPPLDAASVSCCLTTPIAWRVAPVGNGSASTVGPPTPDCTKYYCDQGFRYVRTVPEHPSPSAACFERPAEREPDLVVKGHGADSATIK